ncbi:MAG: hypothetical protein H6838_17990 [Planctomycetes bacterium]|nr:hypothetical protein [Planctomycetota bacterium]
MRLPASLVCLVLPLTLGVSACTKVEFQTVGSGSAVPAALEGEWIGQWQSEQSTQTGDVTLQVQQFENAPVVGLLINHPCLPTTLYDFSLVGNVFELRSNGEVVFSGELLPSRVLVGAYQCDEDAGHWSATWQRELPPVVDLSGVWQGQIDLTNGNTPLQLEFDQRVVQGALEVTGLLTLPLELASPLPVRGLVRSRDGYFELSLATVAGIVPQVVIGGLGDSVSLEVESGLVATSGQPLSFTQGVATFALQAAGPR